jgi:hypothetical protein
MKTLFFILISLTIYSCKKYDCECISVYSNPPKGDMSTSSVQQVKAASKSKASKTCEKYEDEITTCQIK